MVITTFKSLKKFDTIHKMSNKCLVVPTQNAVDAELIPADFAGKVLYTKLSEVGGASVVYDLARRYGEYRPRHGERGVETDPSYQQLIMYAFALKDRRVLVYQRDTTGEHSDKRLSGKVSVGIGGHMDPTDLSLEDSLWRELDEEAEIMKNNRPVSFRDNEGTLIVNAMRELINIEPVGLLKDGRDEVGMVHLGIICMITAKVQNVEVRLKTGEEAVKFAYVTLSEYEEMVSNGSAKPEGWTETVVKEEIKAILQNS